MITARCARTIAAYTGWQNESLSGAAAPPSDGRRRRDRGAFFASIHGTLCHILWGDEVWLGRLAGLAAPAVVSIAESTRCFEDRNALCAARAATDRRLLDWAGRLTGTDPDGDLTRFPTPASGGSGAARLEFTKPRWLLVVQMFNHQRHHRGQVHAMLTAAGARPADTDIQFMPAD